MAAAIMIQPGDEVAIFFPYNLDMRMAIPLYGNLSDFKLSIAQKTFVCEQLDHDFTTFPDIIGADCGRNFIDRYKLKHSTERIGRIYCLELKD